MRDSLDTHWGVRHESMLGNMACNRRLLYGKMSLFRNRLHLKILLKCAVSEENEMLCEQGEERVGGGSEESKENRRTKRKQKIFLYGLVY